MLNKILIIVFITLFTLVIIELVYLLWPKNDINATAVSQNQPAFTTDGSGQLTGSLSAIASALDNSRQIIISSTATTKFEGIIDKISGPGSKGAIQYQASISVKPLVGNGRTSSFYFTNPQNIKVYQKTVGFNRPIRFEDLKEDDRIVMTNTVDLAGKNQFGGTKTEIVKQ